MARRSRRPAAAFARTLAPLDDRCAACGRVAPLADHGRRTVAMLDGLCRLTLVVQRCRNPACPLYRHPYRPEAEGAVALPHGEFGLDLIAVVGALRSADHRSVPEFHQALQQRGIGLAERTVTNLIHRYEGLVAVRLADRPRLQQQLATQERVILAIDGLQPDVVTVEQRHGRIERRELRVRSDLVGYSAFPGLAQVAELHKEIVVVTTGVVRRVTRYLMTRLGPAQADPARLLALARRHWGIENRWFQVAGDGFGEDRQVLGLLRGAALNLLRGRCALWTAATPMTARAECINANPLAVLSGL